MSDQEAGAGSHGKNAALRFGDDPDQYERARPGYPAWVFDALLDGIEGRRVLDVGCGTGVAAIALAERGCAVVGVEPDERMAAVAARRGVPVEVATFEKWMPARRTFDLVCSAQAWHWIDSAVGTQRAGSVLRPGGRFGAFWNGHEHAPDVAAAIVSARRAEEGRRPSPPPDLAGSTGDALRASEEFQDVETRRGTFDVTYSLAQWLEVEASFGANRALPDDIRTAVFAAMADVLRPMQPITVRWHTTLVTASKVA